MNNDWIGSLNYDKSEYPEGISLSDTLHSTIQNNIFAEQRDQVVYQENSSGIESDYNLAYNSDGSMPVGPFNIHDLWGVNPLFVNPLVGDYHLQSASPALEAGKPEPLVANDYDGNPRPQDRAYDIGAYEHISP